MKPGTLSVSLSVIIYQLCGLDKLLNMSEAQFPQLQSGNNASTTS